MNVYIDDDGDTWVQYDDDGLLHQLTDGKQLVHGHAEPQTLDFVQTAYGPITKVVSYMSDERLGQDAPPAHRAATGEV